MNELTVVAALNNLEIVTDFINQYLEENECSMALQMQVDLAVEEIYVNIANYAYHPEDGPATIRCGVGGNPLQVTIEFLDAGKPYNPLEKEDPDVTLEAEEREMGGLGIFMVKNLVDEIKYEFIDGKNILTIIKKV